MQISICIPTYNGAKFIGESLESALCQTIADTEVLVVDDASRDDTVAIVEAFARKDPRVRLVVNSTNQGLVANWNRALDLACGEWIKYLFQDDLLDPTCVERLLDAGLRRRCGVVGCLRDFIFAEGTSSRDRHWYPMHREMVARSFESGFLTPEGVAHAALERFGSNIFGEPTVALIRRDVFEKVGRFDAALAQRCDGEFWIRAGLHCGIAMVLENLASFRVHPDSTSAQNADRREYADEWLDLLIMLHRYLFDPLYEPMRRVALKGGRHRELRRLFWDGAHDAQMLLSEAAGPNGEQLRHDFARVALAYPRIARIPLPNVLDRKLRRAMARIRWQRAI